MEKTLHEKLVAIQSELKAPKGQTNNFGKYKYRSCEDILEAVKPLLKEHNCTLTLSDEIVMVGTRFYVKAMAWLTDGGSERVVTAFAREEEDKKGMDGSQITGAASSYARKYALNGLFCIDDTEDADTMDNTRPVAAKTESAGKAKPHIQTALKTLMGAKTAEQVETICKALEKYQWSDSELGMINTEKTKLLDKILLAS